MPRNNQLDELIASGMTLDEIMAEAKGVSNRLNSQAPTRENAARREAEGRVQSATQNLVGANANLQRENSMTFGDRAKRFANTMALPAAIIPNPTAPVAGGYLALQGIGAAAKDPSAMNVGMAALGAVPLMGPASRALRGARKVEDAAPAILHGKEMFADALGRVRSPRAAGFGAAAERFTTSADDIDQFMPNRPGDIEVFEGAGNAPMNPALRGIDDLIDRWMPNSSPVPASADELADTVNVVDDVTDAQALPQIDDVDEILAGLNQALGGVPTANRLSRTQRLTDMAQGAADEANAFRRGTGFENIPQNLEGGSRRQMQILRDRFLPRK